MNKKEKKEQSQPSSENKISEEDVSNQNLRRKKIILGVVFFFSLVAGLIGGYFFLETNSAFPGLVGDDSSRAKEDVRLKRVKGILKNDVHKRESVAQLVGWWLGCRNVVEKRVDFNYCSYSFLSKYKPELIHYWCRTIDLYYQGFWNNIVQSGSCEKEYINNCSEYFFRQKNRDRKCKLLCEHYLNENREGYVYMQFFDRSTPEKKKIKKTMGRIYINPAEVDFCNELPSPQRCFSLVNAVEAIKGKDLNKCDLIESVRERLICELYFEQSIKQCDRVYKKLEASINK